MSESTPAFGNGSPCGDWHRVEARENLALGHGHFGLHAVAGSARLRGSHQPGAANEKGAIHT